MIELIVRDYHEFFFLQKLSNSFDYDFNIILKNNKLSLCPSLPQTCLQAAFFFFFTLRATLVNISEKKRKKSPKAIELMHFYNY